NSDEPVQGSLPAFEARLADAIMRCIEMAKPASIDLRKLSWDGLAKRIVSCVSVSRSDANSSEV
ncbi:MAG: hypothetical protein RR672_13385, partial [Raoultibacter sp.]